MYRKRPPSRFAEYKRKETQGLRAKNVGRERSKAIFVFAFVLDFLFFFLFIFFVTSLPGYLDALAVIPRAPFLLFQSHENEKAYMSFLKGKEARGALFFLVCGRVYTPRPVKVFCDSPFFSWGCSQPFLHFDDCVYSLMCNWA